MSLKNINLKHITLLIIIILLNGVHLMADISSKSYYIDKIEIIGNYKTKPHVIHREFDFTVGSKVDITKIKLGVSNLKNTQLFSSVDYEIKDQTLYIKISEKWTTIPIVKFSSGGGVSQSILGVYDPHLFGRYLESGAQFEKLEHVSSHVLWFKNPRLFDKKVGIDVQYWATNRIRTKYNQDAENIEVINGFLMSSKRVYLGFTNEFDTALKGSIFIEHNSDSFSDKFVTKDVKKVLETKGLPVDTQFNFLGVDISFGRVNTEGIVKNGQMFSTRFKFGESSTNLIKSFSQLEVGFHFYKSFFNKSLFAQRLLLGTTTTNVIQYWYYLGGLDRVRGYSDNRFAGRNYILSNTEFRKSVYEKKNYIIQGIGFLDALTISENFQGLDTLKGASTGLGFRLILPQLYRFVLRFDYAIRLLKTDEKSFSFGVQQFF